MKKNILFMIVLLTGLLLIGCNKTDDKKIDENIEKEKNTYIKYVQNLKTIKETSDELPFDIDVVYDKTKKDEIRYQVIIDNPKNDIKNIEALTIHNKQTDDIFPSVGIFDDKVDLIKDKKPSGVILVGYIPYNGEVEDFECEIKTLIKYQIDENSYTSYFVTKK